MDNIITLLKLMNMRNIGASSINQILSHVDIGDLNHFTAQDFADLGFKPHQLKEWQRPNMKMIDKIIAWAEVSGQKIITCFDSEYPFLLSQIATPPPLLFVKGCVETLNDPQLAIVGSRDCSPYGEYWAKNFTKMLGEHNITITSGLAIGIDGVCHKEAVKNKAKTIAVLGSGLDNLYPRRHAALADEIIENQGALISELLPHIPPLAQNFPRRNRIISGLALATLVIEATANSGSLITAAHALEQGRDIFALPNTLGSAYSAGCHKLIKEGAMLVENIDDILNALEHNFLGNAFAPPSGQKKAKIYNPQPLSIKQQRLPTCAAQLKSEQKQALQELSLTPLSIDDWARSCNISTAKLLVIALDLELLGLAKAVSGGYVISSS